MAIFNSFLYVYQRVSGMILEVSILGRNRKPWTHWPCAVEWTLPMFTYSSPMTFSGTQNGRAKGGAPRFSQTKQWEKDISVDNWGISKNIPVADDGFIKTSIWFGPYFILLWLYIYIYTHIHIRVYIYIYIYIYIHLYIYIYICLSLTICLSKIHIWITNL